MIIQVGPLPNGMQASLTSGEVDSSGKPKAEDLIDVGTG